MMKSTFTSLALILGMAFLAPVNGQKGVTDGSQYGHGEDSINCLRNLSLYREFVKQNNYKDAYPYWKNCFTDCPLSSKNLYIDGIKIIKDKIDDHDNPDLNQHLIDSLVLIYNQRIKYFPGDEGRVLGFMAIDLLRYRRDDIETIKETNAFMERSIRLLRTQSSAPVLATFITSTITLYQNDLAPAEKVVRDYALVMEVLDLILNKNPDDKDMQLVKTNVDQNFAASCAANCEALVGLFGPQYEANKLNAEFLTKVTDLLVSTGCTDSKLYRNSSESLHKLSPSASSAFKLARIFRDLNQTEKASAYYLEAIQLEAASSDRARYYVELGDITFQEMNNLPLARDYTRKAAQEDPSNGLAYLLMGNIIASVKDCGSDDFEQKALYWLAVDYFVRTRQADPSLSEIVNKYISDYSQFFPDVESIFFYGLKEGDEYTITCWINEKTRVRSR